MCSSAAVFVADPIVVLRVVSLMQGWVWVWCAFSAVVRQQHVVCVAKRSPCHHIMPQRTAAEVLAQRIWSQMLQVQFLLSISHRGEVRMRGVFLTAPPHTSQPALTRLFSDPLWFAHRCCLVCHHHPQNSVPLEPSLRYTASGIPPRVDIRIFC